MRIKAIQELYPEAVIFIGDKALNENQEEIAVDEALVADKMKKLEQEKIIEEENRKLKYEGKDYKLNGKVYKISFTKEDQDALLAIKVAFEDFRLAKTNFEFSNGTKILIKNTDFEPLAKFFVENRSQFFK
jgi:hypothetical protein